LTPSQGKAGEANTGFFIPVIYIYIKRNFNKKAKILVLLKKTCKNFNNDCKRYSYT